MLSLKPALPYMLPPMPLRQYVANYMRVFYEVKCSLIDEPKVLGDRAENNDFGKQVRGGVDIFS